MYSCSGHDFDLNDPDAQRRNFYITFGATEEGWHHLCALYGDMREHLIAFHVQALKDKNAFDEMNKDNEVFFNPFRNVNPSCFMLTATTRRFPGTEDPYNALVLSADGTYDPITRGNFISTFLQYLKNST